MILRFRAVVLALVLIAVVIFCAYSIPTYLQLLAHQPARGAVDATSFPPQYAFFMGGILAAVAGVAAFIVLLIVWAIFRRSRCGEKV